MREFLDRIESIRFEEVDELYKKKEEIKVKYQGLDNETKEIYKWYFYFQLCLLKNPLKEMLWTYLNSETDLHFKAEMSNEYRIFCNKRKKIGEKSEFD